jgi:glycine/D-amino acid oxidase-like deaminating enzyme
VSRQHTARVAIVGGGILGCAAAYHLARAGVGDVLVLERDELNAATTSQAAGLIGQLRTSAVTSAIVGQTLADIATLEADGLVSGLGTPCGFV